MTTEVIVLDRGCFHHPDLLGQQSALYFYETSNPVLGETKTADSVEIVGKSKQRQEVGDGSHPGGLTCTNPLEHKLLLWDLNDSRVFNQPAVPTIP